MNAFGAFWNKRPWLVPVCLWLAVVSWRPAVLGFYHDDWCVFLPLESGDVFSEFSQFASRPVSSGMGVLVRWLIPMNAVYYQILLALLMILSAYAISAFAQSVIRLLRPEAPEEKWAGALAASMWILTPWDLGATVWPCTFPLHITIAGFCLMSVILLGESSPWRKLLKTVPIFIFISLIFENMWMAFFPLICLYFLYEWQEKGKRNYRSFLLMMGVFGSVQAGLLLYNRILAHIGVGINKSYNPDFILVLFHSLKWLPNELTKAVFFPPLFWALVLCMFAGLAYGAWHHPKRHLALGILFGIVAGCLLSMLIYAGASYEIKCTGIFSRTTATISAWLCLLPALLLAIRRGLRPWMQRGMMVVLPLLMVVLLASTIRNIGAWGRSWEFQKTLLSQVPALKAFTPPEECSLLIVDAEGPANATEGLDAFWDISGALLAYYPELAKLLPNPSQKNFAVMMDAKRKRMAWDGTKLTVTWCKDPNAVIWILDAPGKVGVWDMKRNRLEYHDKPFLLGCDR